MFDIPNNSSSNHGSRGSTIFYSLFATGVGLSLQGMWLWNGGGEAFSQRPANVKLTLEKIPFDGQKAYDQLVEICQLGPRIAGADGMRKQQDYLQAHFAGLGGKVTLQEFEVRHPQHGAAVRLANLIVEWQPEKKERILLCTHYDTRPFADRDANAKLRVKEGAFLGANDGASGTALLCELGRHMKNLKCPYGVDFVFFDGEELIYNDSTDEYFLGSSHFAKQYAAAPPPHRYKWGVLFDMIGDANLEIYREVNSMNWRDTRPLVNEIWKTANSLGVREFIPQTFHEVRDDHLPLHNDAHIPTIDIIDFDYVGRNRESHWHTTQDTPEHCSALSLAKVGWVTLEWLKRVK